MGTQNADVGCCSALLGSQQTHPHNEEPELGKGDRVHRNSSDSEHAGGQEEARVPEKTYQGEAYGNFNPNLPDPF